MLARITKVVFIIVSLSLMVACKEEPKQEQKPQITQSKPTPEQEERHKKMLVDRYKPSEPKGWTP